MVSDHDAQTRDRATVCWERSTRLDDVVQIPDVEPDAPSAGKHATAKIALTCESVEDIYADREVLSRCCPVEQTAHPPTGGYVGLRSLSTLPA